MHVKYQPSLGAALQEFIDSDPVAPQLGEQWIRITTIAPSHSPRLLSPLGLILNQSAAYQVGAVKTLSSVGII